MATHRRHYHLLKIPLAAIHVDQVVENGWYTVSYANECVLNQGQGRVFRLRDGAVIEEPAPYWGTSQYARAYNADTYGSTLSVSQTVYQLKCR